MNVVFVTDREGRCPDDGTDADDCVAAVGDENTAGDTSASDALASGDPEDEPVPDGVRLVRFDTE